jgi:hypothetical protein
MSNKYEITGRIIALNETQTFPSGFKKREFVIEELEENYPQKVKLEAVKDGCDKLDAYSIGDTIKVSFNIRGNEYNGKYYVNLVAWRIEGEASQKQPTKHEQQKQDAYQPQPDEEEDFIPF